MSDNNVADNLIARLKGRDLQKQADFERAQFEERVKRGDGEATFKQLWQKARDTASQITAKMGRPVVQFQDQSTGEGSAFRLIGENSRDQIVDVRLAPSHGSILFEFGSQGNKQKGSFDPRVTTMPMANFYMGQRMVTVDDMCTILIEFATGLPEAPR